ncbi:hypothetical protein [Roseospira navarrensis]|uniref:Uncharacterized protein n=1 Tax=Roseospira navarrensis TaxID=140058 RepID=A0A7X1ZEK3_9PROT|nr:hypothetical protein [Roseospira navarrensis]MQX36858.1 hypothetical protein [Roseospira navarrensis]
MSTVCESVGTIARDDSGWFVAALTVVPGRDGVVRQGGPSTIRAHGPYLEPVLHLAAEGRALVRRARCAALHGARAHAALEDACEAVVARLTTDMVLEIDDVALDREALAVLAAGELIAAFAPSGAAERRAVA